VTGNIIITQDKNLQAYLTGDPETFVKLCRKFVEVYYPQATIRELWVVNDEWVDILATIFDPKESRKMPSSVFNPKAILFRFFRGLGTVDEREVRGFFDRVTKLEADRGVCVSAGEVTHKAIIAVARVHVYDRRDLVAVLGIGKWYEFSGHYELDKFLGGGGVMRNDEKFPGVGVKIEGIDSGEIWGLREDTGHTLWPLIRLPHYSNTQWKQYTTKRLA